MRTVLSEQALGAALGDLPGWASIGGVISKEFAFPTYKDGIVFAASVGFLADVADHHPELLIGYRKVVVRLSTHEPKGITNLDLALAAKIEALLVPQS